MPHKMDRFTKDARRLVADAQHLAEKFGHSKIAPLHLILAMTRLTNCDAFDALDDNDIIESKLRPFVESKLSTKSTRHPLVRHIPTLSDEFKKALELSVVAARSREHNYIATAHMLIGVLGIESENVDEMLKHFDVQAKDIIKRADYYLRDDAPPRPKRNRKPLSNHVGFEDIVKDTLKSLLGFINKTKSDDK